MVSSIKAGRIRGRPIMRAADRHDHIISFRIGDALFHQLETIAADNGGMSTGMAARNILDGALTSLSNKVNLKGRRIKVRR